MSASSSEGALDLSRAYEQLHPRIQAWIWDQGWKQLRATQARAVEPILARTDDIIISAPTASGKTEAAWLPICTALANDADAGTAQAGVKALYIGPLKALINDQFDRLGGLCAYIDIPVRRRHGDVAASERSALQRSPDGILLITPESLEALFVLHGPRVPAMLGGLRYVVIDELHSFVGTERGAQVQSLLHRVELAIRRRVPRVALSATLADPFQAAEFLRPGGGRSATAIGGPADDRAELLMQLRGYLRTARNDSGSVSGEEEDEDAAAGTTERAIAQHIFEHLRGKDNLVFANSRSNVEAYADLLRQVSDENRVPVEFLAHHGNLSREHREGVEERLKSGELPATAICTSTLEMGIDIGSVDSVAQIGAPGSVAALRQRLGRSGRRGNPAVLRLYIIEDEIDERTTPGDLLRTELVETIATIELLLEKWYEPPNLAGLHLSTLIQQLLSVIAQHGGATASELFAALCASGPFARVTKGQFIQLLRDLAGNDIIFQASDGTLLPGKRGERLLNHYSFYSAFQTPEEYRLVADGRALGSLPILYPVLPGSYLIFAGRRWKVLDVDSQAQVIDLTRSQGGRVPNFTGGSVEVADGVRQRMRTLYESNVVPAYLDRQAGVLLDEGRKNYRRLRIEASSVLGWGRDSLVFPWRGDRVLSTLMVLLTSQGMAVSNDGIALTCSTTSQTAVLDAFGRLTASPPPDPSELARHVPNKMTEKHDIYLGEGLLNDAYAARNLDVPGAWQAMNAMMGAKNHEAGRL